MTITFFNIINSIRKRVIKTLFTVRLNRNIGDVFLINQRPINKKRIT